MISIVMPYWNRSDLLTKALDKYEELYSDLDLEIVIADDGSQDRPDIGKDRPWKVWIVRLPAKTEALNPCVPINAGVKRASGDIILLTNPETYHRAPIIQDMKVELGSLGEKGHVAAAVWATERGKWYVHSSMNEATNKNLGRAPMPVGAGLHFCVMFYKTFFEEIEGFDEDYRAGQAYDDNDFLWKLQTAGAKFAIRDDLIVDHSSTETTWPAGGIQKNSALFYKKWKEVLSHV